MMSSILKKQMRRREAIVSLMAGGLTTADQIAARLRVSQRTVYRDMRQLMADGLPIISEAGIGYMLRRREGHHVSG